MKNYIANLIETRGTINASIYIIKQLSPLVSLVLCYMGLMISLTSPHFNSPEASIYSGFLFFFGCVGCILLIGKQSRQ